MYFCIKILLLSNLFLKYIDGYNIKKCDVVEEKMTIHIRIILLFLSCPKWTEMIQWNKIEYHWNINAFIARFAYFLIKILNHFDCFQF